MLDAPDVRTFDLGSTVAVLTAAIVVLQLHVSFERDDTGAWRVVVEKPSASDGVVKALLEAISGFTGTRDE